MGKGSYTPLGLHEELIDTKDWLGKNFRDTCAIRNHIPSYNIKVLGKDFHNMIGVHHHVTYPNIEIIERPEEKWRVFMDQPSSGLIGIVLGHAKQEFSNVGRWLSSSTKPEDNVDEEKQIEISYANKVIASFPTALKDLSDAVLSSKYIPELRDDWDEEGSKGYEHKTWCRAVKFLELYSKSILRDFGLSISQPKIFPGPQGGIDFLWKTSAYRLLVTVPEDLERAAIFYGDNYGDEKIKGSFTPEKFNAAILLFLFQNK